MLEKVYIILSNFTSINLEYFQALNIHGKNKWKEKGNTKNSTCRKKFLQVETNFHLLKLQNLKKKK